MALTPYRASLISIHFNAVIDQGEEDSERGETVAWYDCQETYGRGIKEDGEGRL